jgi:hypothetical protein
MLSTALLVLGRSAIAPSAYVALFVSASWLLVPAIAGALVGAATRRRLGFVRATALLVPAVVLVGVVGAVRERASLRSGGRMRVRGAGRLPSVGGCARWNASPSSVVAAVSRARTRRGAALTSEPSAMEAGPMASGRSSSARPGADPDGVIERRRNLNP